jgi:hypothetical protein
MSENRGHLMNALIDRLERKGDARRTRGTEGRRRVLPSWRPGYKSATPSLWNARSACGGSKI